MGKFYYLALLSTTLVSIGAFAHETTPQNDNNCCLCNDCDMMMNEGTDLYDMDQQVFVSCERFAEEVFRTLIAGSDQCSRVQSLFQTPCCLTAAARRHQEEATSDDRRRMNWSAMSPTTGTTRLTTVPFQPSSLTTGSTASTPSSYENWGAAQQSAEQSTSTNTVAATRSSQVSPSYYPAAATTSSSSSGGSCPQRSGICNFNCPSVPADRLTIHVSIDPGAVGRTDLPYFSAGCGDVQNQMHCQNLLTTDLRCSLLVARFRAECGCGGYQNNAAAFYGGVTQSKGAVGWTVGN
jgi:hypothetical protein